VSATSCGATKPRRKGSTSSIAEVSSPTMALRAAERADVFRLFVVVGLRLHNDDLAARASAVRANPRADSRVSRARR
jgi:hypothetical protein